MPRKNPVPSAEQAICNRLLAARTSSHLSRAAVATLIEIKAVRLASYELGRVPLPYLMARKLCQTLNINQRWLATGQAPQSPYIDVGEVDEKAPESALFSSVFPTIEPHLRNWLSVAGVALATKPSDITANDMAAIGGAAQLATSLERLLELGVSGLLHYLPDNLKARFARHIMEAAAEFQKQHAAAIDRWWDDFDREFEEKEKTGVDKILHLEHNKRVATTWDNLRKRLITATAEPGKKAELARRFDFYPARLSGWLSGEHEPGAVATLQMLNWVEEFEGKLKSAANATTLAAPTTPETKPHEKDRIRSPRKGSHKRR